jgi:hypothetical protein
MVATMTMKRRNFAVDFLLEMLGAGQALPAHVITQEAAARKISLRTLTRAKAVLQVQARCRLGLCLAKRDHRQGCPQI